MKMMLTWYLASKLLERQSLSLWNEQSSEATAQHEEGVDLEDVVEPRRSVLARRTARTKRADDGLGDD